MNAKGGLMHGAFWVGRGDSPSPTHQQLGLPQFSHQEQPGPSLPSSLPTRASVSLTRFEEEALHVPPPMSLSPLWLQVMD